MAFEEPQRRRSAEVTKPVADDNVLTGQIVDAAVAVHRALGPGLLESVYEQCLACEIEMRGLTVSRQVVMDVVYRDLRLNGGFRMDLLVDRRVAVEVKAGERLLPIHKAQLLTYLKLSGLKLGLLINFNVLHLRDGLRRVIQTPDPLRFCASAVQSAVGPGQAASGN